jgi:DNA-binding transcriptional LysR family regulator
VPRAADVLRISQPAVSKLVQDLEAGTGLLLFDRLRRRLHPTAEGRRFHEEVEQLFLKISRIEHVANEIRANGIGELRVATLPALGLGLIPRALVAFREKRPGLKAVLSVVSSQRVVEMIAAGEADVGFAYPVPGTPATLLRQSLASLPAVAALPAGHPLAARETLAPEDFDGLPLVSLGREDRSRDNMDLFFEERQLRLNVQIETQFAGVACELVAGGAGPALIDPVTASFFRDRIILRPVVPAFVFEFGVLTLVGHPESTMIRDFVRTVEERVDALDLPSTLRPAPELATV